MYQNYMNLPAPTITNGLYPQTYNSPMMRQEIVKVNGENGARAYQLAANSSVLLLDETQPVVWLVQTDGAGYKTVTPFTITPQKTTPEVDVNELEERIKKIEERLNESDSRYANMEQTKKPNKPASGN